ncbi:MAG TPA: hypothetical protein VF201_02205 [Nitrolancea sp.]
MIGLPTIQRANIIGCVAVAGRRIGTLLDGDVGAPVLKWLLG